MSRKLIVARSLFAAPVALTAPAVHANTVGSGIAPATVGNSAERPMAFASSAPENAALAVVMTSAELPDLPGLPGDAAARVGDRQVRNRGTIGGSVCWNYISACKPSATMNLVSSGGERSLFRNQSGAVLYPVCRLADRPSEFLTDFCRSFLQDRDAPAAVPRYRRRSRVCASARCPSSPTSAR